MVRFRQLNPDIPTLLHSDKRSIDLEAEGFHCAIRYCQPDSPLVTPYLLSKEWLCPVVCGDLKGSAHAASLPLLADDFDTWDLWSQHVQDRQPPLLLSGEASMTITDSAMLLQAVESGEGIGLGRRLLVADALAKGDLACLSNEWVPARGAYYIALPPGAAEHVPTLKFMRWLRAEFDQTSVLLRD